MAVRENQLSCSIGRSLANRTTGSRNKYSPQVPEGHDVEGQLEELDIFFLYPADDGDPRCRQ
jgi:hypothetical protein